MLFQYITTTLPSFHFTQLSNFSLYLLTIIFTTVLFPPYQNEIQLSPCHNFLTFFSVLHSISLFFRLILPILRSISLFLRLILPILRSISLFLRLILPILRLLSLIFVSSYSFFILHHSFFPAHLTHSLSYITLFSGPS